MIVWTAVGTAIQALIETGLNEDQVVVEDDAVEALIKGYCREAGVRNLQQHVEVRMGMRAWYFHTMYAKYQSCMVLEALAEDRAESREEGGGHTGGHHGRAAACAARPTLLQRLAFVRDW